MSESGFVGVEFRMWQSPDELLQLSEVLGLLGDPDAFRWVVKEFDVFIDQGSSLSWADAQARAALSRVVPLSWDEMGEIAGSLAQTIEADVLGFRVRKDQYGAPEPSAVDVDWSVRIAAFDSTLWSISARLGEADGLAAMEAALARWGAVPITLDMWRYWLGPAG